MKTETPKYMCLEDHVHIPWVQLRDPLWDNELDEEKQVVERVAHTIRQHIHRMVYESYTYPEPMSITFAAPEML